MINYEYRPAPKPTPSKRVKPTQKQKGDISTSVDRQLKERSHGLCELCNGARATERAHLTGRKQIDHKTKVTDLIHLCTPCHDWLDENPDGIKARNFMARAINTVLAHQAIK